MKKLILVFLLIFSVSAFSQMKITDKVVEAGCGMCMFKQKSNKGCSMAIKMDGKIFTVEGLDKKYFGDAHAENGYCKMVKKAKVSGEIRRGKFYATKFEYL